MGRASGQARGVAVASPARFAARRSAPERANGTGWVEGTEAFGVITPFGQLRLWPGARCRPSDEEIRAAGYPEPHRAPWFQVESNGDIFAGSKKIMARVLSSDSRFAAFYDPWSEDALRRHPPKLTLPAEGRGYQPWVKGAHAKGWVKSNGEVMVWRDDALPCLTHTDAVLDSGMDDRCDPHPLYIGKDGLVDLCETDLDPRVLETVLRANPELRAPRPGEGTFSFYRPPQVSFTSPYGARKQFGSLDAYARERKDAIWSFEPRASATDIQFGARWADARGRACTLAWKGTGELLAEYTDDGSVEVLGYVGELVDAQRALAGWSRPEAGGRLDWVRERLDALA